MNSEEKQNSKAIESTLMQIANESLSLKVTNNKLNEVVKELTEQVAALAEENAALKEPTEKPGKKGQDA